MRVGTPGFVASRLIEAREARGLTQTLLSERTGLKPQSISHYEQGRQSPSPEALDLLCGCLEVPLRFFLHPVPRFSTDTIFFRSAKVEDRTARLKDARRLNWLKEIAACTARYVKLVDAIVPAFRDGDVEAIASRVRADLHLGSAPVADVMQLLEKLGCIVSPGRASFSQWDAGIPWVSLDCSDNRTSWFRYRAAHELGHLIMHRPAACHKENELQADHFARALLLPAAPFASDVWAPTIDALLTIKKDWNCPVSVMITRCGEIGRFDANQVKRAMVNLARRGWNAEEPRETPITFERPPLLARSIRKIVEEGIRDVHALLCELALSPADVEDLTGLEKGYFAAQSEQFRIEPPNVVIAQI